MWGDRPAPPCAAQESVHKEMREGANRTEGSPRLVRGRKVLAFGTPSAPSPPGSGMLAETPQYIDSKQVSAQPAE